MKNWKTKQYNLSKNISFSFSACFSFCCCCCLLFLISNNTLHVMFYTYICHWNTFQYKYIIQTTFHITKQYYARVTSKDICFPFIILFICLFPSCLDFLLFHVVLLLFRCLIDLAYLLYLKVTNHIYLLNWCIIYCLM